MEEKELVEHIWPSTDKEGVQFAQDLQGAKNWKKSIKESSY